MARGTSNAVTNPAQNRRKSPPYLLGSWPELARIPTKNHYIRLKKVSESQNTYARKGIKNTKPLHYIEAKFCILYPPSLGFP